MDEVELLILVPGVEKEGGVDDGRDGWFFIDVDIGVLHGYWVIEENLLEPVEHTNLCITHVEAHHRLFTISLTYHNLSPIQPA